MSLFDRGSYYHCCRDLPLDRKLKAEQRSLEPCNHATALSALWNEWNSLSERTVVNLSSTSPELLLNLVVFLRFCRTFLSGGTRIRTGDTMILSHLPSLLGMR
jgi:hypothetical protein